MTAGRLSGPQTDCKNSIPFLEQSALTRRSALLSGGHMTAKIHALPAITDRESVVRTLEKMLQQAHEGHVQAVAVAWVGATGRVNATWSDGNSASMLGAV